ncbi:MAG: agmatine deiminase family protein [Clostridium sp.]|nr:agmatine deiminase family protein [Clostridium sp.]
MLYFSSQLNTPKYKPAADRMFAALDLFNIKYKLLNNTKDIWLRDFMPVKTKSGKYVSFRYEPSYLAGDPQLRTNFKTDIAPSFKVDNLVYTDINLDGGNVIFSPSKEKVIISDRVYSENPSWHKTELTAKLAKLLEANVIIIPSLKSDMTGHADGMVRFVNENTVVANAPLSPFGFETKVKKALQNHDIEVLDFPYFDSNGDSAIGCYLNFLETEQAIFLPVFGVDTDNQAVQTAKHIFHKAIIPVNINEIAADGGLLNCISWET